MACFINAFQLSFYSSLRFNTKTANTVMNKTKILCSILMDYEALHEKIILKIITHLQAWQASCIKAGQDNPI